MQLLYWIHLSNFICIYMTYVYLSDFAKTYLVSGSKPMVAGEGETPSRPGWGHGPGAGLSTGGLLGGREGVFY